MSAATLRLTHIGTVVSPLPLSDVYAATTPERETVLGDTTEMVVWVRRSTSNANVTAEWDERW